MTNKPQPRRSLSFSVQTTTNEGTTEATNFASIDNKPQPSNRSVLTGPPTPEVERESTLADTEASYSEIPTLPSSKLFYPWDRISIRRMGVPEVRKAYQAHVTSSFRSFVQVLTPTIDRDAYALTIGDFWFLMYYHQNNSFPKSPATVSYTCTGDQHLQDVRDGKLAPDTLSQKTQINFRELKEITIDDEKSAKLSALITKVANETGVYLYPPTVQDTIEMTEDAERAEEELAAESVKAGTAGMSPIAVMRHTQMNKDREWINDYASFLHPQHGTTLAERREFLENPENNIPLELFNYIDEFRELSEHGIVENVKTKCTVCAAEKVVPTTLSAAMFLPDLQRAKLA